MKEKIKKYLWLWEMIGAALILAMSIVIAVDSKIIPLVVGIIFAVLGLLRIIPLVKTTDDKLLQNLYAVQLGVEIIVGGLLIAFAFINEENGFTRFISNNGHYFIGGTLYLRGFIHFFATTIKHEEYPFIYFIVNIAILTIGTILIVKNVDINQIRWFIFALGIICTLFVGYAGFKGYNNYRGQYASIRETKKIKKLKEKNIDGDTEKEEVNIDDTQENNDVINIDNVKEHQDSINA